MKPERIAEIRARYEAPASPLHESAADVPDLLAEVERLRAALERIASDGGQHGDEAREALEGK